MGGANKNMAKRVLIKRQCWTFYSNPLSIHAGLMTMCFACKRLGVRFFFTVCVSIYGCVKKREPLSAHQSCSCIHGSPHFLLISLVLMEFQQRPLWMAFHSSEKGTSAVKKKNFTERNHCVLWTIKNFINLSTEPSLVRGRYVLSKPTQPPQTPPPNPQFQLSNQNWHYSFLEI